MSKTFKFQSNHDCKDFNMIYRLTHSEYYLRVADFAWKTKTHNKKLKHPTTEFLLIFKVRNKKSSICSTV